ncbi:hypothetical protein [Komagataeibacter swingsii]|uniref:Uncharacterized protein n=1 Tax=Komagataeibacter swingsii TaxID=215220 RepID=A0A2V4RD87_9PROT|nr:hypothetical protein [Komagataeibacter swingsii]PYD70040.1 hypothetical protein CFR76_07090 [Komagataeibacter swingsii]GBQ56532.1 hypothetical protein AA16373_0751 [Komagataeibacter swingsii DSM 16373]
MTADLAGICRLLGQFTGTDLTRTLSRIEGDIRGMTADNCAGFLEGAGAGQEVLSAAAEMKRLAGQIDVTIHALGILLCLPHILEPGERVESVSLGAGNTGRKFDLETNLRVAEFKFIRWRGGPESIRQNGVFKDYLLLAAEKITKRKYLYLLGTKHALRFLRGGRALSSILSRNVKLQKIFLAEFGDKFRTVGEYYAAQANANAVHIEDVSPWLSELAEELIAEPPVEPV